MIRRNAYVVEMEGHRGRSEAAWAGLAAVVEAGLAEVEAVAFAAVAVDNHRSLVDFAFAVVVAFEVHRPSVLKGKSAYCRWAIRNRQMRVLADSHC